MTTLRERKRLATRAALLDAGRTLFEKEGFDKTSVDDIAAAALISKFTFYNFFDSKDALLTALHLEIFQSLAQDSGELIGKDVCVADVFVDRVSKMAEWYEQNKGLTRVIVERGRLVFPSEKPDNCLDDLTSMIRYGQQKGEFRDDLAADDIARYAFVLAHGEKRNWVDRGCDYSLKEKFVQAANFVLMALRK